MIAFASFGDAKAGGLRLGAGFLRLTQHWLEAADLVPSSAAPVAGIDLRPDGIFVFAARMRPDAADRARRSGSEFQDGLWHGNVVEMFLGHPSNGRYLEVHLAPNFKWWACTFSGVRQREQKDGRPLPLAVVDHRTDKQGRVWQGRLRVPADVLCKLLGVQAVTALRGNLTAIIARPTGPASYFSHASLPGAAPDFHQPSAWLPLRRDAD